MSKLNIKNYMLSKSNIKTKNDILSKLNIKKWYLNKIMKNNDKNQKQQLQ